MPPRRAKGSTPQSKKGGQPPADGGGGSAIQTPKQQVPQSATSPAPPSTTRAAPASNAAQAKPSSSTPVHGHKPDGELSEQDADEDDSLLSSGSVLQSPAQSQPQVATRDADLALLLSSDWSYWTKPFLEGDLRDYIEAAGNGKATAEEFQHALLTVLQFQSKLPQKDRFPFAQSMDPPPVPTTPLTPLSTNKESYARRIVPPCTLTAQDFIDAMGGEDSIPAGHFGPVQQKKFEMILDTSLQGSGINAAQALRISFEGYVRLGGAPIFQGGFQQALQSSGHAPKKLYQKADEHLLSSVSSSKMKLAALTPQETQHWFQKRMRLPTNVHKAMTLLSDLACHNLRVNKSSLALSAWMEAHVWSSAQKCIVALCSLYAQALIIIHPTACAWAGEFDSLWVANPHSGVYTHADPHCPPTVPSFALSEHCNFPIYSGQFGYDLLRARFADNGSNMTQDLLANFSGGNFGWNGHGDGSNFEQRNNWN